MSESNFDTNNFKIIYGLFEDKNKYYQKIFIFLILITSLFFLLAFLPYFSLQYQRYIDNIQIIEYNKQLDNESLQLKINQDNIKKIQQRINELTKTVGETQNIRSEITKLTLSQKNNISPTIEKISFELFQARSFLLKTEDVTLIINKKIEQLKNGINEKNKELENLSIEQRKITEQWEKFNAPYIGQITLSFSILIKSFPILLAIGFSIILISYSNLIKFRRTLHYKYKKNDNSGGVITDLYIPRLIPMLIEPLDFHKINILIILFPLTIFVLSIVMNMIDWYFFTPQLNNSNIIVLESQNIIYSLIYIAIIPVFIFVYFILFKEINRYNNKLPSNPIIINGEIENKLNTLFQKEIISLEQYVNLIEYLLKLKESNNQKNRELYTKHLNDMTDSLDKILDVTNMTGSEKYHIKNILNQLQQN